MVRLWKPVLEHNEMVIDPFSLLACNFVRCAEIFSHTFLDSLCILSTVSVPLAKGQTSCPHSLPAPLQDAWSQFDMFILFELRSCAWCSKQNTTNSSFVVLQWKELIFRVNLRWCKVRYLCIFQCTKNFVEQLINKRLIDRVILMHCMRCDRIDVEHTAIVD